MQPGGQVADFTAVEYFDHISSEVIRPLAERNPWPKASFRRLILPTDVGFGLGRMYEMLCGAAGENIHIVRSKAEALAWMTHQRRQVQVNAPGDEARGLCPRVVDALDMSESCTRTTVRIPPWGEGVSIIP
jgi:hypothetical protein